VLFDALLRPPQTERQAELAWAKQNRPDLLQQPDVKKRVRQMQQAEAQVEPRAVAIAQLEDVVQLAQGLMQKGAVGGGL